MQRIIATALAATLLGGIPALPAQADSISSVEGARSKERSGRVLNRQDREKLRRYGGNDDGYNSYGSYRGYRSYEYGPRAGFDVTDGDDDDDDYDEPDRHHYR